MRFRKNGRTAQPTQRVCDYASAASRTSSGCCLLQQARNCAGIIRWQSELMAISWLGRPINPGWYRLNANVPVAGNLRNYGHCLRTRAAPGWRARSQDAAPSCVAPQNAGNLLHRANSRPKPRSHARQRHQQPIQPFPIADLRRTEVGGHN